MLTAPWSSARKLRALGDNNNHNGRDSHHYSALCPAPSPALCRRSPSEVSTAISAVFAGAPGTERLSDRPQAHSKLISLMRFQPRLPDPCHPAAGPSGRGRSLHLQDEGN